MNPVTYAPIAPVMRRPAQRPSVLLDSFQNLDGAPLPASLPVAGVHASHDGGPLLSAKKVFKSYSKSKHIIPVLRGVDFSETSRIVTFLTPGRGRLACLAKGARRRRSPFQAMLDTLNRDEIVYYWKDGREVQQLGEAALLDGSEQIDLVVGGTNKLQMPPPE